MDNWNRNDYQGRSKNQVQGAYAINNVLVALLFLALIALTLLS
tara:strand:+ start:77 stop:205 length:129 start_codon:yes stop_codon:yes gene_type:complete